jgi:hypothetical protein
MLVKRNINNKNYAVEMGKPLYKQGYKTGAGLIEFALIKTNKYSNIYDIIEVSTGMVLVPNVGRLKKLAFVNICMLFCVLGSKEIKSRMSKHEKIENLPLWKEEDEDNKNEE